MKIKGSGEDFAVLVNANRLICAVLALGLAACNNPASGTKNTDEPKPATVPTISEKSAIRKNGNEH